MKEIEIKNVLSKDELYKIDAYFRAANYLSVGQLYLRKNPLLREPLTMDELNGFYEQYGMKFYGGRSIWEELS